MAISIHALREEGDWLNGGYWDNEEVFLSTPSARRATGTAFILPTILRISIHALREEGDPHSEALSWPGYDFYPRPPRGGRPTTPANGTRPGRFLSTPSARRATVSVTQV